MDDELRLLDIIICFQLFFFSFSLETDHFKELVSYKEAELLTCTVEAYLSLIWSFYTARSYI